MRFSKKNIYIYIYILWDEQPCISDDPPYLVFDVIPLRRTAGAT